MVGVEILYSALRTDLQQELLTHIDFYMSALGDIMPAETLQARCMHMMHHGHSFCLVHVRVYMHATSCA